METLERSEEDGEEEPPPFDLLRVEGVTLSQEVVRTSSSTSSPPEAGETHCERDSFRRIDEETASQHVHLGLCEILARLRSVKQPSNRSAQAQQVIILGDRLSALESSTNRSLPSIQVTLENIRHRLDCIQAGAQRLTRGTHRPDQKQDQPKLHDIHEYDTDNKGENGDSSKHVRKRATQAGTSRAHQQHLQPGASYYTQTRSRPVDETIKSIYNRIRLIV